MPRLQVVVVGGGAAGFFGAITCATAHPQTQVTLLEAGRQVLSKVRISGGGRCNVTHACFDPALLVQHYPRGSKALRGAFTRFQPRDMVAWLRTQGVTLKTEADGRMFPVTDDSETIVTCLLHAAKTAGVQIHTGTAVTQIHRDPDSRFRVVLRGGETILGDRLLLATGSSPQGHHLANRLGHQIVPPVPSLFTLHIRDPRLQDLAGIAVDPVRVRLQIPDGKPLEQTGALLITHWGVSGPAILKLSAWGARYLHDCAYQAALEINWLPLTTADALRQMILTAKADTAKRTIAAYSPLPLPHRLWEQLVAITGISPQQRWADLSNKQLLQLLHELTQGRYPIQGKGVFKEEFVTCGGVSLKQVDFKTMESRCCRGLYFAGEVLDIDGVTGGFNFQSAWTTAWIAGQAIGSP